MSDQAPSNSEHAVGVVPAGVVDQLRNALGKAAEAERYRALAAFLVDLADQQQAAAQSGSATQEQAELLGKRLARAVEERAQLTDEIAGLKADLEHRAKQLDAELARSKEMERISGEQRSRLKTVQQELSDVEDQLVARNNECHTVQNQVEELRLKLQRAELAAGDTSRVNKLEDDRIELARQVEELRQRQEQLRMDKDAEIARLKAELAEAQRASSRGADETLRHLWERLADAETKLAPGGAQPTPQAVERLIDTFVNLVAFAHEFDQTLRPFLTSFARHTETLARPWDAYARSDGIDQLAREIIEIEHGKPPEVLKARLQALKRWVVATIIGSDTAIESVAHELEEQLRGKLGLAEDPNRKVRDYLKEDGHHLFHQHIRELRGKKLADIYAHGA